MQIAGIRRYIVKNISLSIFYIHNLNCTLSGHLSAGMAVGCSCLEIFFSVQSLIISFVH